jgi:hypothetical protein
MSYAQQRPLILRLWQAGTLNAPAWQALVEDTRTGAHYRFSDLKSLKLFLETHLTTSRAERTNDHES